MAAARQAASSADFQNLRQALQNRVSFTLRCQINRYHVTLAIGCRLFKDHTVSYVLIPYLVDLREIESVIGCKDASIVDAVKTVNSEKHAAGGDEGEEHIPLSHAIRHLIMGEPLIPDSAHQYGYALQEICAYKGEVILPDYWSGVRWDAVEECGLEDLFTKSGSPVKMPPTPDFPVIAHIKRDDLAAHLRSAEDRKAGFNDDDLIGLLNEYIGWLEAAQTSNKDIVLFYH